MAENPTVWIDILSDSAVTFAAQVWGKNKAETWSILSRAIEAGNISQRMTHYQFQVHVKLTADPEYFNYCPVCKTATRITDISCTNCQVDLAIARRPLIEEEFKNFPIPPSSPSSHTSISVSQYIPQEVPHMDNENAGFIAKLFFFLGNFIAYAGGILALLYTLFVIASLFGWVNAIIALIFFPLAYTLFPFYLALEYGNLTLIILNYGVGVIAALFVYLGNRFTADKQPTQTPPIASPKEKKLTLSAVIGWALGCFILLIAYGWFKDTVLFPTMYADTSPPISNPTIPPPPTTEPRPTPTDSCFHWSKITSQMEGRIVCVFGTMTVHTEDWENELTRFYFGTTEQFFIVSNYRWSEPFEGECITTTGEIFLNTYKVPYIKIQDQINFCQP